MISIIVPVYNTDSKTLYLCLSAIQKQTYRDFELIVIDDGSTNHSYEVIREFCCEMIRFQENRGVAVARNIGANKAKGDILVFVDSDVILPDNALEEIVNVFRFNRVDAVIGMPDDNCKFDNLVSQHFNLRVHHNYSQLPEFVDIIYGSICAVRTSVFFDIKGFDADYKRAGVEDVELGFRLSQKGYRIKLDKNLQINHYKHVSLFGLLRNDFNRAGDRIKLMLRHKKFKDIEKQNRFISTPKDQILSLLSIPFILYMIFIKDLILLSGLLLLFLVLNISYLEFVYKKKGKLFALKSYLLLLIDMSIVFLGIISGYISYKRGFEY